jgi:lipocalin-like protein
MAVNLGLQIKRRFMMSAKILGTWKLVSASSSTSTGERNDAQFGTNPTGLLTYDQDGRMSAMISHGGRKLVLTNAPGPALTEAQAEAFRTFVAYAGRYTIKTDEVIHHVEISFIQDWVGTDQIRTIKFEGEHLVLGTLPMPMGGKTMTVEFIFKRLPAQSRPTV